MMSRGGSVESIEISGPPARRFLDRATTAVGPVGEGAVGAPQHGHRDGMILRARDLGGDWGWLAADATADHGPQVGCCVLLRTQGSRAGLDDLEHLEARPRRVAREVVADALGQDDVVAALVELPAGVALGVEHHEAALAVANAVGLDTEREGSVGGVDPRSGPGTPGPGIERGDVDQLGALEALGDVETLALARVAVAFVNTESSS